jgi:hypothetical protein
MTPLMELLRREGADRHENADAEHWFRGGT